MFYNSIGSVKVDGLLKLPRFFRRTFAARKAALATEGCVEVRLFRRGRQFFALSIWESPVAMKGYAQTSVHRTFMEEDADLFITFHNAIWTSQTVPTDEEAVAVWEESDAKRAAGAG